MFTRFEGIYKIELAIKTEETINDLFLPFPQHFFHLRLTVLNGPDKGMAFITKGELKGESPDLLGSFSKDHRIHSSLEVLHNETNINHYLLAKNKDLEEENAQLKRRLQLLEQVEDPIVVTKKDANVSK